MMAAPQISTSYGRRLAIAPSPICIPRDPTAAAAFAKAADLAADEAMNAGRFVVAERLAHAAFEARSRINGGRA